jgi:hypothetical protein
MCMHSSGKPRQLKTALCAFKVVARPPVVLEGGYISPIKLGVRYPQNIEGTNAHSVGSVLRYRVGASTVSPIPETEGIYLFRRLRDARAYKGSMVGDKKVLRVRVPAGATVIHGVVQSVHADAPALRASKVFVEKELS